MAAEESQRLLQEAQQDPGPQLQAIRKTRQGLPAFGQRQQVLDKLAHHRVLVISGATGMLLTILLIGSLQGAWKHGIQVLQVFSECCLHGHFRVPK